MFVCVALLCSTIYSFSPFHSAGQVDDFKLSRDLMGGIVDSTCPVSTTPAKSAAQRKKDEEARATELANQGNDFDESSGSGSDGEDSVGSRSSRSSRSSYGSSLSAHSSRSGGCSNDEGDSDREAHDDSDSDREEDPDSEDDRRQYASKLLDAPPVSTKSRAITQVVRPETKKARRDKPEEVHRKGSKKALTAKNK